MREEKTSVVPLIFCTGGRRNSAVMTEAEKLKIDGLSSAGLGYRKISVATGLPENTVKSYLSRRGKAVPKEAEGNRCLRCGKDVRQRPGRKKKKFCCDKCRNEWWNSHLKLVKRKAVYSFTCPVCGLEFASYGNNHRKYCSRECYIKGRFKEEGRDDKTGDDIRTAI